MLVDVPQGLCLILDCRSTGYRLTNFRFALFPHQARACCVQRSRLCRKLLLKDGARFFVRFLQEVGHPYIDLLKAA